MRFVQSAILMVLFAAACLAKDSNKPKTVGEGMELASKLSQLTVSGSKPFHLKATIAELDSPDSDYKAEVEMYWVAPDRWRRSIKSPDFSQIMVVDGEKVSEQDQGEYFPWWLNDFVTAIFELAPKQIRLLNTPLPDLEAMQKRVCQETAEWLRRSAHGHWKAMYPRPGVRRNSSCPEYGLHCHLFRKPTGIASVSSVTRLRS